MFDILRIDYVIYQDINIIFLFNCVTSYAHRRKCLAAFDGCWAK